MESRQDRSDARAEILGRDLRGGLDSVERVVHDRLCVGCGVCVAVCPVEAIRMRYDGGLGLDVPIVDHDACMSCGKCLDVCFGFSVDPRLNLRMFGELPSSIAGNYIGSYVGFARNNDLRFHASSGGIVTALLLCALEEKVIDGAIVTRMKAGFLPKAEAFVATTREDLLSTVGSKYCPVSFAECLRSLKDDGAYAAVGLPCHIYALRKLSELNPAVRRSIQFYLGILCGGMPSYFGTEHLLKIHGLEGAYVRRLEYRGSGWPGRMLIEGVLLGRAKTVSVPYPDYWHGAFSCFTPYRCTLCHDGFNDWSDISCGDAWLAPIREEDNIGTSLVIARTKVGEKMLQIAQEKEYIRIHPIGRDETIRSQSGLVWDKGAALRARMNVCILLRRPLPVFDTGYSRRMVHAGVIDHLQALRFYTTSAIASRRSLWPVLETYLSLTDVLSKRLSRNTTKRRAWNSKNDGAR